MEHRILREGGARDEGAAHRDGEGRAGLEGVEAGILLGGGAGARGLRCPSGAAGGNTRPAAAGTLVPPPGGAWAARWERELYPRACTAARQAREVSHPFRPWEASLTGVVTLHTPECLSLYYDAAERTGGPHGVTLRQGSAWALPGGSPLTLGELFPPGFRWRAWALAEVERQLRARLSAGESWFAPDWEARLPRSFDPERFYLTEAGPVIYFPLYSIAPYAEGIPAFSLAIPGQKENTPEE